MGSLLYCIRGQCPRYFSMVHVKMADQPLQSGTLLKGQGFAGWKFEKFYSLAAKVASLNESTLQAKTQKWAAEFQAYLARHLRAFEAAFAVEIKFSEYSWRFLRQAGPIKRCMHTQRVERGMLRVRLTPPPLRLNPPASNFERPAANFEFRPRISD